MDSIFDALIAKSLAGGSGGGGGGTDNYNALQNKPQINGTTLTGNKSLSDLGIAAASDIPTVNNGTLTIQKNGTKIDEFKANQSANTTINITVPTTASDVSALPNTTKYAAALSLTINSSTYVVTGQLKDQNGDNLGSAQTIDLPLETMVVGGSYDDEHKKIVLTLKNGNTVDIPVADLVSGLQTELSATNKLDPAFINYDSTHAAVTEAEKTTWNGKQDSLTFDGTYDASTNPAATVSTVTNAVNALDVTGDSDISASKTIKSWSETDGKVSVTTQDISISASQAGLGNVTNDAQVKKISSSTAGNIVTWNAATGDTVADSGVSIETNTSFSATSDTKIPTSKAIAQNAAASTVLKGYTADAGTAFQTLAATDNIVDAFEKVQGNTLLNKTNILSIQDVIGSILVYGTQSWDTVQAIVRSGLAPQYYPVGTLLYDNMDESTGKAFRVVGYDNFFDETLTDQGYSHSMTLLEEKLNYPSIQFDAPEAWLYLSYDGQDIVSGTAYRFTIPNYDASYGGNKTYIFTATANVSKETAADAGDGGQLTLAWAYQQNPSSVNAFENSSSTTPLFGNNGASISEWNGTDECINLGTIKLAMSDADSTYGKLNHIHRVRYGSNNYYQSGMRQWLNATTASDWWQPTTIFDRVYGSRSTAGRLSTLNANMVAKIATPTITCITNNLFETGFALNTQYTVKDKIFLLTHTEVGLSDNPNIGNTLAYYVGAANSKRIKYKTDNTAQHWWLRTPYPSLASYERIVGMSGALNNYAAGNHTGAAAACIIQ